MCTYMYIYIVCDPAPTFVIDADTTNMSLCHRKLCVSTPTVAKECKNNSKITLITS